ncbi:MAG: hypothetical protein ACI8X5_000495 [Planctomycetota bacterium]|jgi:hypothetical protein
MAESDALPVDHAFPDLPVRPRSWNLDSRAASGVRMQPHRRLVEGEVSPAFGTGVD